MKKNNGSQRNGHMLGLKGFKQELLFHCEILNRSEINNQSVMKIYNLVNYINFSSGINMYKDSDEVTI